MRWMFFALPLLFLTPAPLQAQEMVNPGIWGNGLLGNNAMNNARENTRRATRPGNNMRQSGLPTCSIEIVPSRERRRMEAEYNDILRASGRQRANLWAQEQGRVYKRQMRSQGVCR